MPPNNDFDFDDDNSASAPEETRNERPSKGGPSRPVRGNAAWTDIVSGLSPMQWATIIFVVSSTFLFYRLQAIPTSKHPLVTLFYLWNTLVISLLLFIVGGGCLAFGHVTASKAPDATVNLSATIGLIGSLLSVLLWIGFLGALIYLRVKIEEIMAAAVKGDPSDLKLILRIAMGCFCGAILTGLGAELVFGVALRRAAMLLRDRKLQGWSVVMIVLFGVSLLLNLVFWGMVIFDWGKENIIQLLAEIDAPKSMAFLIQLISYLFVLAVSGCYWYTLRIGKWTLTHPEGAREELNGEDDDSDEPRRKRGRGPDEDDAGDELPRKRNRQRDEEDEDRPRRR